VNSKSRNRPKSQKKFGRLWGRPLSSWGQRSKNKPPCDTFAPFLDNMAQEPDRYHLPVFQARHPRFGPLTRFRKFENFQKIIGLHSAIAVRPPENFLIIRPLGELEIPKSAETGNKLGSSLEAPPGERIYTNFGRTFLDFHASDFAEIVCIPRWGTPLLLLALHVTSSCTSNLVTSCSWDLCSKGKDKNKAYLYQLWTNISRFLLVICFYQGLRPIKRNGQLGGGLGGPGPLSSGSALDPHYRLALRDCRKAP